MLAGLADQAPSFSFPSRGTGLKESKLRLDAAARREPKSP